MTYEVEHVAGVFTYQAVCLRECADELELMANQMRSSDNMTIATEKMNHVNGVIPRLRREMKSLRMQLDFMNQEAQRIAPRPTAG